MSIFQSEVEFHLCSMYRNRLRTRHKALWTPNAKVNPGWDVD